MPSLSSSPSEDRQREDTDAALATNHGIDQTSPMLRQDGATAAVAPSQREMRAIRRSMGIPVTSLSSPNSEVQSHGSYPSKKKRMDSDSEFDEQNQISSIDPDSSLEDEEVETNRHPVNAQSNIVSRASVTLSRNMISLQDSKFDADRTDLRLWHELRYVRTMWSREEDEQLRKDCLVITDGCDVPTTSNAMLWTACFDRYGVPLSDIFTYGLRPHPENLRLPRKKLLSPQFCDNLTTVLVHPIFRGNAILLRYMLQFIVWMRVGVHVPPMGTMPDLNDADLNDVDLLAETLLLEEDTPQERVLVHADSYLFISQKRGARFHPDIVMLEDLLHVNFVKEGYEATAPRDNIPNSRFLFFLQLWDVQFLLRILEGISFGTSYLPVERYKSIWLSDTRRIQKYVGNKLDSLVQQWFLNDERNYRIRQKLKDQDTEQRLYDIPEEDFNPTYARSQYVTSTIRAVLEGDFLKALCTPPPPSPESPWDAEEGEAPGLDAVQLQTVQSRLLRDVPVESIEEDDADIDAENNIGTANTNGDGQQVSLFNKGGFDGGASSNGNNQAKPARETSYASIQSIRSSEEEFEAANDHEDSPCSPSQGVYARRYMAPSDCNK
ncbi:hypothetical protein N8I77_006656 [Diaporthe amygdali]|uniref:Uncharacterized protein n=1 Tax=Phomopsis amygdali TaxID=1214568 RepID=A0AAD9W4S1_PHOAM|nr:hypothetical protein N8I77_006656 [Diaporthe amygdali]